MSTKHHDIPSILTFHEYLEALKCSRSTGYRLIWNGTVKAVKVGGRLLIHRSSIQALLMPNK
jgi:excisionase family DNA binding protein